MSDCEREHLDDAPEGLLYLRLLEYAEAIAPELDTTPTAWMHQKVEDYARAKRSTRRDHLRSLT